MNDLISRQAAYDTLTAYYHHKHFSQHIALKDALDKVPSIDPIKRGKWVDDRWEYQPVCSVCRHPAEIIEVDGHLVDCNDPSGETGGYYRIDTDVFLSPYCPYCGAQMENPAEDISDEDECDDEDECNDNL